MTVRIREEPPSALAGYARVPIAFVVRERLVLPAPGADPGGLRLRTEPVAVPYVKDYDAVPGQHPTTWPGRFDLTRWGILAAWADGTRVGGAVVAWETEGEEPRDGRSDVAVLWDLRVRPDRRGEGIGAALFRAADRWATARGARRLEVETQDVNVAACRFYARQGCTLGAVNRSAYPALPDEAQLLWYLPLGTAVDAT